MAIRSVDSSRPGYAPQGYYDHLPFFGDLHPRWISVVALVLVCAGSAAGFLYAYDRWGRLEGTTGHVNLLNESVDAKGLRIAPDGSVLGYTVEGSTLRIWRWPSSVDAGNIPREARQTLDLKEAPERLDVLPDLVDSRVVWLSNGVLYAKSYRGSSVAFFNLLNRLEEVRDLYLVAPSSVLVRTARSIDQIDFENQKIATLDSASCDVAVNEGDAAIGCPGRSLSVYGRRHSSFDLDEQAGGLGLCISGTHDVIGVATQRKTVQLRTGDGPLSVLTAPGLVTGLACGSDGSALATGMFDGVVLLRAAGPRPVIISGDSLSGATVKAGELSAKGGSFVVVGQGNQNARLVTFSVGTHAGPVGIAIGVAGVSLWSLLFYVPVWRRMRTDAERRRAVSDAHDLEKTLTPASTTTVPGGASIPLSSPPPDLVRACAAGECVAFAGAGIGAQAGFPTWRPLIAALMDEAARRQAVDRHTAESLRAAFDEGQTDLAADGLVSAMPGGALLEFLSTIFLNPAVRPTPVHALLRQLNVSAVLTSNFDRLLDDTFADRYKQVHTHLDSEPLLSALSRHEFFLLKLYGSLDRPESVLLAPTQYYEAMASNALFSSFMEGLFTSRTLLFVGASLEGIEAYLNGIKFPTSMPRKHYALVAVTGASWRAKADLLARRYGIEVLPYTAEQGYPELERFLAELGAAVSRQATAEPSRRGVAALRKVVLENIGPFDSVEVELDRHWNILLGDNGVGKSTILRAIAVGIIGADAAPYADRLIKAGATLARITLETTEGKRYITQIRRGDQRAIVESYPSARVLDAEGWLALGFPALRTFTWGSIKELPPKGAERATSNDLLPLASGDVDPRLETLKSWFIDVDYQDAVERAGSRSGWSFLRREPASATASRSRRDEFFQVINRLTPGMRVEPLPIDPSRKEVLVRTNGQHVIRIEGVSQGTQSLLGWVGILLQRLHDFYAGSASARQPSDSDALLDQFAIVLMDEIDAHMHPKWQQTIVGALKELFPNCQFIATTHSPLIVVGMERREVLLVGPEGDGEGPPVVKRSEHGFRGWGADQVLTDPLFGLFTVIDPKIHSDVERYTALAAKDARTAAEEQELLQLAGRLKVERPSPKQRDEARMAFTMIEKALDEQLKNIPAGKRERIRDEAKVQMQENVTGSRRPG